MIKEILDVRTGKREQVGSSGGSTELKLVATGTFHSNIEGELQGTLDNEIQMNKPYLIEYYTDSTGAVFTATYIYFESGETHTPFAVINLDNDGITNAFLSIYGDNVVIKCGEVIPALNREMDYIKVYELPFTLGGAE